LEELREKIEDRDYDLEELKQEVKNLKLQEIKSGSSIKQIND
jgi:predicted HTH domain antitoxin